MSTKHNRQKIGHKERELLEAINLGDYIYGMLTSGTSTKLFYKNMRDHAAARLEAEEKRLIKNRLKALERKNLITFTRKEGYRQATLTPAAQKQLAQTEIIRRVKAQQPTKWDGKWRIVSFDIPTEQSSYRIALRHLLLECNFLQIQQSVYVCPYFYRELYDYLANNRALGGHVHFFEGKYIGDDTALRKEFSLDK